MIDYKTSNIKRFKSLFVIIDNFSEYLWCKALEKSLEQKHNNLQIFFSTSKRSAFKIDCDGGAEFNNSTFQNFLKGENIQHYSRFTDNGPSTAQKVIRTIRILVKKLDFVSGNAKWLRELTSVINQCNNTIHRSIKMSPVKASEKPNEKEV